jgi:hypothetical protein
MWPRYAAVCRSPRGGLCGGRLPAARTRSSARWRLRPGPRRGRGLGPVPGADRPSPPRVWRTRQAGRRRHGEPPHGDEDRPAPGPSGSALGHPVIPTPVGSSRARPAVGPSRPSSVPSATSRCGSALAPERHGGPRSSLSLRSKSQATGSRSHRAESPV